MRRPPGNDLKLGTIAGTSTALMFPRELRDKHLYVCGATGVGKSKFLEHLIRQDIMNQRASKCGLLLIDPHGLLYDNLAAWLAETDLDRPVVLIDLRQDEWVVAYNLLRHRRADASVVVDGFVDAMAHTWGQSGTDATPLFARWAGNVLHVLYEKGYTLAEAAHLLGSRVELRRAMTAGLADPMSRRDWELANSLTAKDFEAQVSSTVNRFRRFVSNANLRDIFGQPEVSLDLGSALEEGSIVLVNISRENARISREDAELFATLLLNDLWTAAQERGKNKNVKPFYVYLDEFQKVLTPTIAENLDEARGFGLHLTLAHQFPKQLRNAGAHGQRVWDSVMENASSKMVFRLSDAENLQPMAQWLFTGAMDPDEVKLQLHSTKVMGYREEYRQAYGRSETNSTGGTRHQSETAGTGISGYDALGGEAVSWNEHISSALGETDSWSDSVTTSESDVPVLVPVMGKELSHVQFRSLDEQLFRAMAVLFDQEQRQGVARLVGMKAPVSIFTPTVRDPIHRPEQVKCLIARLMERLPFAMRSAEARKRVMDRHAAFSDLLIESLRDGEADDEPHTAKRRIRS